MTGSIQSVRAISDLPDLLAALRGRSDVASRTLASGSWLEDKRPDDATRLSDRAVAEVVKRSLATAGNNPRRYAGHSLRAGLITQAAMARVSERAIQNQSGHRSLVVLRRYTRDGSLFRENGAAKVGL